ncbi:MAG TPA: hypothetical protein QGF58_23970 [Myxococcota bacterium]|nr:hypothetical protein [Myxococcota bacterium]
MNWRALTGLGLALALGIGAPVAEAQQPPKTVQKGGKAKTPSTSRVNIEVMVVHAKDGPPHVDPKLEALNLDLDHLRYQDFRVLSTNKSPLVSGKPAVFEVEGGRKVKVTLISKDADRVRLQVQLFKGDKKLLETTVAVKRGTTFVVAGSKYDGGMLLLPITARY